jgi:hypothetical protein
MDSYEGSSKKVEKVEQKNEEPNRFAKKKYRNCLLKRGFSFWGENPLFIFIEKMAKPRFLWISLISLMKTFLLHRYV